MNANTIFLIIQLLIYFLFISCLLVGDTYLSYMIYNSNALTCEAPTTTLQPTSTAASTTSTAASTTSTAASTTSTAASTTAPNSTVATYNYSVCYDLTDAQLGFVRFKIVMFWILCFIMTAGAIYMFSKLYHNNEILFGIIIAITLIMTVFIIVGGVFMTQYAFAGGKKSCNVSTGKSNEYCYNLNDTELGFAKMSVVFGWLYSFSAIITIGLFIWEANLG